MSGNKYFLLDLMRLTSRFASTAAGENACVQFFMTAV